MSYFIHHGTESKSAVKLYMNMKCIAILSVVHFIILSAFKMSAVNLLADLFNSNESGFVQWPDILELN